MTPDLAEAVPVCHAERSEASGPLSHSPQASHLILRCAQDDNEEAPRSQAEPSAPSAGNAGTDLRLHSEATDVRRGSGAQSVGRRPRVVVTRTGEGAARLCALLEAAGLEPVCLPAIAMEPVEDTAPLDAAAAQLGGYEWIVFPSANAARAVLDRARAAGRRLDLLGGGAGTRIVAGPATARVVVGYGLPVALVPSPFSAERTVQALAPLIHPGSRVLLPRAEAGLDRLASGLRALGAVVDEVVAYRTVQHEQAAEAAFRELAAGRIDGVTFFSPSAVTAGTDALAVALPPARRRALRDEAVVACIGPTTAAAAEAAGWRVAVVPSDTTASALVAALAAHLRGRTSRRIEEWAL